MTDMNSIIEKYRNSGNGPLIEAIKAGYKASKSKDIADLHLDGWTIKKTNGPQSAIFTHGKVQVKVVQYDAEYEVSGLFIIGRPDTHLPIPTQTELFVPYGSWLTRNSWVAYCRSYDFMVNVMEIIKKYADAYLNTEKQVAKFRFRDFMLDAYRWGGGTWWIILNEDCRLDNTIADAIYMYADAESGDFPPEYELAALRDLLGDDFKQKYVADYEKLNKADIFMQLAKNAHFNINSLYRDRILLKDTSLDEAFERLAEIVHADPLLYTDGDDSTDKYFFADYACALVNGDEE